MIAGAYYHSIDAANKDRRHAKKFMHRLNVTEYRITKKAKEIELITNTGSNFYIEPPFHCDYGYNIVCGDNVYFNVRCAGFCTCHCRVKCILHLTFSCTLLHPLEADLRRT
jgi:maltose O-acetyltransferase